MLRLKANYLWPAVWGRAFAEDDPHNHATATGVRHRDGHLARGADDARHRGVEPARRAAVRDAAATHDTGPRPVRRQRRVELQHNADALKAYWTTASSAWSTQNIEGVMTLGMRGNGDAACPTATASS